MALPPHLSLGLPEASDPQPTREFPSSGPGVTPEPTPRRRAGWLPVVLVVAVLAIIGVSVGIGVSTSGSTGTGPAAPAAPPAQVTVPNVRGMTMYAAGAALQIAGLSTVSTSPAGSSSGSRVISQTPAAGSLVARDTQVSLVMEAPKPTTTTPPPPPAPAKAITARDWALIARDPSAHIGESIIVYGQVTQFDSATGRTTFRANVDGVKHPVRYGYADYDTNTFLTAATAATLGDLVQKDVFRAEVVVAGAYSYETTMGGTLTVPQLLVVKVEVTGQAK